MAYPKHPDTVMVKADNYSYTKNITEYHIWKYYDSIKSKLIPILKGSDLFIVLKTAKDSIYMRHPFDSKTAFIRINNAEQFDKYNTGRVVEFHLTSPQMTDLMVLDMDPAKNLQWSDIKQRTLQLYDYLNARKEFKKVEIYYTGARSFHIWCYLKSKKDIDSVRNEWKEILKKDFHDKDYYTVDEKSPKKNQLNIDFSPVKVNGGFVAPFSIRVDTGLVSTEVPAKKLSAFKKTDSTIDKVYKKTLKKEFPWDIEKENKKAFRLVLAYYGLATLTQPLVSRPPYVGDQITYKTSNNKYVKEELVKGYRGKFVIQKHQATSLHFDLRLEFPVSSLRDSLEPQAKLTGEKNTAPDKAGTVYRSFAIPKHKLPTYHNKLLAMETEDHAMSWGTFEGTIEEGYGAGTVEIFDKGTFELLDATYDKKYIIEFKGKDIKGIFALIKTSAKTFLWVKVKDKEKYASVIDYPRQELLPELWEFIDEIPHIKDIYRDKITLDLYKSAEIHFKNPQNWIIRLTVTGSMTTNLYSDLSDLDVNVEIDYDKFRSNNPDISLSDDYLLRNFIRDKIYPDVNSYFLDDLKIKYFIIGVGHCLTSDFKYDLTDEKWLGEAPRLYPLEYNPDKIFEKEKAIALQAIKIYDMYIEDIITKLKEYEKLTSYLKVFDNKKFHSLKDTLYKDLQNNINTLKRWDDIQPKFRNMRYKLPKEKLKYPYIDINENWEAHNIIFKYLEFFDYSNLIWLLKSRLTEEQKKIVEQLI